MIMPFMYNKTHDKEQIIILNLTARHVLLLSWINGLKFEQWI